MSATSPEYLEDAEVPAGVRLFDPDDHATQRDVLYDTVRESLSSQFPIEHGGVRLELHDVDYRDPPTWSRKDQRMARLKGKTLARRLQGTYRLFDTDSGQLLDEKTQTIMKVPFLTERGTYIHNGNDIGSIRQPRLLPGPYSRVQDNGQLETQFNIRVGTGTAFRVGLEPETGQYRMKVRQSNLHLYSMLKDLGIDDATLEKSWGPGVLAMNRDKYDIRALDKAYERMVPAYVRRDIKDPDRETMARMVRERLDEAQVNERVARTNLPNWFDRNKSASWGLFFTFGDLAQRYVDGTVKRADVTKTQLGLIIDFLNITHQAGISDTGKKEDMEAAILTFVESQMQGKQNVLQASRDGLENVWNNYAGYEKPDPIIPYSTNNKMAEESSADSAVQSTYVIDDGDSYVPVGVDGLLASTERLLSINRGLADADDRDALKFKRVHSTYDMVREHVTRDSGKIRRRMMYRLAKAKNLKPVHPGYFDSYMESQLVGNPLSSPMEEINPMHLLENARRMTLMGPGGIGTDDAITSGAQAVSASQFGFIDPVTGPESSRAGIDTRLSWGTRIGSNGRLYRKFYDRRQKKMRWMSPEDLEGLVVKLPD